MSCVFQNIDPPPPSPPGECVPPAVGRRVRGEDTLAVWRKGWGVNILEGARHSSVLYKCKYFVFSSNYVTCQLVLASLVKKYGNNQEIFKLQCQSSNKPISYWIWKGNMCTALQRNFDLCIPRKGAARPQSQLPHSCVCGRFMYSHDRSTYFPAVEYADRSWKYINRTPKHKCRNWDCGRAVPFLGIYVSNFKYSIFAVWVVI